MIQKVTVKSWKSYEQHTPKGNEKMKKQEQQKNGCRERSLTSISRRVSSGAMLVALAMIFSYVESLIPINLGVPGIKLGVANLVTVTGLYILAPISHLDRDFLSCSRIISNMMPTLFWIPLSWVTKGFIRS